MKKTLLASALLLGQQLLVCSTAGAAGFGYSYLELGYGEVDDGDALFFGGAAQLQRGLGVVGSYYTIDFDSGVDADGEIFTAGLQFNTPIGAKTDFVGSVQLINAEYEERIYRGRFLGTDTESVDDTGLLLRGGIRHALQQNLQFEGDIAYNTNDFWDDDELGIKAGVRFYADRQLSFGVGIASDQELDGLYISGRYDL